MLFAGHIVNVEIWGIVKAKISKNLGGVLGFMIEWFRSEFKQE